MSNKQLISIVVPTYNEEGNVEKLFTEVQKALKNETFEIIYIDDGSHDQSLEAVQKLSKKHKEVKFVSFSRNFGHQAALRAGLRYATGDAVISMDADLQHPPKMLPQLLKEWRNGHDVVYTIRRDTKETSFFKRLTSWGYYGVLNFLSGLKLDEGAADFRLMDRKVVDVVNEQHETDLFLRGYISWIGFKQLGLEYVPAKRFSGSSKYSLKKMLKLAHQGIMQFSVKPLRLALLLAIVAMAACILYVFYAIWAAFISDVTVPGWLSLVVLIVFLQGIQFLLIGLVGEYLGRTFIQTKQRPEFIVSAANCHEKKNT